MLVPVRFGLVCVSVYVCLRQTCERALSVHGLLVALQAEGGGKVSEAVRTKC